MWPVSIVNPRLDRVLSSIEGIQKRVVMINFLPSPCIDGYCVQVVGLIVSVLLLPLELIYSSNIILLAL